MNLEVLRQQNKNEQAQLDNILPVGSHVMSITPPEKNGILPLFKNIWAIGHIKSEHLMELCNAKQAAPQAICSTRCTKEGANQAS